MVEILTSYWTVGPVRYKGKLWIVVSRKWKEGHDMAEDYMTLVGLDEFGSVEKMSFEGDQLFRLGGVQRKFLRLVRKGNNSTHTAASYVSGEICKTRLQRKKMLTQKEE